MKSNYSAQILSYQQRPRSSQNLDANRNQQMLAQVVHNRLESMSALTDFTSISKFVGGIPCMSTYLNPCKQEKSYLKYRKKSEERMK